MIKLTAKDIPGHVNFLPNGVYYFNKSLILEIDMMAQESEGSNVRLNLSGKAYTIHFEESLLQILEMMK